MSNITFPLGSAMLSCLGEPVELCPEASQPGTKVTFTLVLADGRAFPAAAAFDPVSRVVTTNTETLVACIQALSTASHGPLAGLARICERIARGILTAANTALAATGSFGFIGMRGFVMYLLIRTLGLIAWIFIAMWSQPFWLVALVGRLFSPDPGGAELAALQDAIHQQIVNLDANREGQ